MVDRPTRIHTLMRTAYLWAERSTCSRLNVGCVIHRNGRILVQGYNGAPAGLKHCNHTCNCSILLRTAPRVVLSPDHHPSCNSQRPCTRAVHAEQNAISFAARWGVGLEGAEAVITHQPCVSCAQSLINAGISHVIFAEPYRLRDGLNLLQEANMGISRFLLDSGETQAIG